MKISQRLIFHGKKLKDLAYSKIRTINLNHLKCTINTTEYCRYAKIFETQNNHINFSGFITGVWYWEDECSSQSECRGQRTMRRNQFFCSTMWVLGIALTQVLRIGSKPAPKHYYFYFYRTQKVSGA